jgi:hypothetical protein
MSTISIGSALEQLSFTQRSIDHKGEHMINKTWKILLSGLLAICLVILLSIEDLAIARTPQFATPLENQKL